jgi:hypothetical protein
VRSESVVQVLCENLCEKFFPKSANGWEISQDVENVNLVIPASYVLVRRS